MFQALEVPLSSTCMTRKESDTLHLAPFWQSGKNFAYHQILLSGLYQLIRSPWASIFSFCKMGIIYIVVRIQYNTIYVKIIFRKALSYDQIGKTPCLSMYYRFSNLCKC